MSEPVQDGGELNEAEKSNGKLVIAGGNAAEALDAAEEVFDAVASAVVAPMERAMLASTLTRGDATVRFLAAEEGPNNGCIESLFGHRALAPQRRHYRQDRLEVMPLSWRQAQSDRATICKLGVDASLGPANLMLRLSAPRIGFVLVDLEVRAVHVPQLSFCTPGEHGQQLCPQAVRAPSPPSRIDRTPRAELRGHMPPRTSRARSVPHRRDHGPVILQRPAIKVPICQSRQLRPLTLIF